MRSRILAHHDKERLALASRIGLHEVSEVGVASGNDAGIGSRQLGIFEQFRHAPSRRRRDAHPGRGDADIGLGRQAFGGAAGLPGLSGVHFRFDFDNGRLRRLEAQPGLGEHFIGEHGRAFLRRS